MRKRQIKGKGLEGVLGSLPYCDDLELGGYVKDNKVFFKVGEEDRVKVKDKYEMVFHSHPRKAEPIPSVRDIQWLAVADFAKVSIIACFDRFIVIEKKLVNWGWIGLERIDRKIWKNSWKELVEKLGFKVSLYGREDAYAVQVIDYK